jgi:hypothetical protein
MFATLQPTQSTVDAPVLCIFCGSLGGVDFVLNIILFVPLGMAARLTMNRWPAVVMTGVATTVVIETLQWRMIPGRDASLGDLIANTAGTLIGAWLAAAIFRWWRATGPAARAYARVSSIVASIVVIISTVLLQPEVPDYPLAVQWKPLRPMMDPFRGELVGVEVKGRSVRAAEHFWANEAFDPGTRSVTVRARIGTPPPAPTRRPAIIVRIASLYEEGFSLMQRGEAVIFRSHMVGEKLKLRSILVGLPGAFSVRSLQFDSGSFVIEAESRPRGFALRRLSSETAGVSVSRTVGLAWTLLLPWDVALNQRWLLANAVWLAALVFPTSFFLARSVTKTGDAGQRRAWWPLLLIVAVLIATPLTGLGVLGVAEWAGVLLGISAGWLLARWCARLGRQSDQHVVAST